MATCVYGARVVHMRLKNELCLDHDDVRQKGCDDGCIECEVKKALDTRGLGMEGISEVTIKVMYKMGYPRLSRLYGKLRQKAKRLVSWARARCIQYIEVSIADNYSSYTTFGRRLGRIA